MKPRNCRVWIGAVRPVLVTTFALLLLAVPAHASFPGANGKITFDVVQGHDSCIYSINPNGTGNALAAPCPPVLFNTYAGRPVWAADGHRLAFHLLGVGSVFYVTDGQNPTFVTITEEGYDIGWSPDGRRLVLDDNRYSQAVGLRYLFSRSR